MLNWFDVFDLDALSLLINSVFPYLFYDVRESFFSPLCALISSNNLHFSRADESNSEGFTGLLFHATHVIMFPTLLSTYVTVKAREKVFYRSWDDIDLSLELARRLPQAGSPEAHKYYISHHATVTHPAIGRDGSNSLFHLTTCGHFSIFQ